MVFAFRPPKRGEISENHMTEESPSPLRNVYPLPSRSHSRPACWAVSAERARARRRESSDKPFWALFAAIYTGLAIVAAYVREYPLTPPHVSLLGFFLIACLVSVLTPVAGPRGQRIFWLPGMAIAAILLLPPVTATLPMLCANAVYAARQEAAAARRGALLFGNWVLLAMLLGGMAYRMHLGAQLPLVSDTEIGVGVYAAVYGAGRVMGTMGAGPGLRGRRLRNWYVSEGITLLASAPIALFMSAAYQRVGMDGLLVAESLFVLLLVMDRYGFEVGMLREQVRAMETISAVTLAQTDPENIALRFIQLSAKLIQCDRGTLWLTDDSRTRLRVVASHPLPDMAQRDPVDQIIRFGEGPMGRVADKKQAMIVCDGRGGAATATPDAGVGGNPYAVMLLPLVAAGETVGVARFERDTPQSYGPRDVARVMSLAAQAAATISNVRMHQDVYNQAVTDALTGLYNRRHVQSALADERRRAERYGHDLSLVMLDVDGFKSYNDAYGHPQGDFLLKQLADLLREKVRNVDILGRYGGEEFIVVMPQTSKREAYLTAERLRNAVAGALFHGPDGQPPVSKTISLGIATYPRDASDTQSLVELADKALYLAKNLGRNQSVFAESPDATGSLF
jgi:diguanylate cyclase (GGDEF)-like protein